MFVFITAITIIYTVEPFKRACSCEWKKKERERSKIYRQAGRQTGMKREKKERERENFNTKPTFNILKKGYISM